MEENRPLLNEHNDNSIIIRLPHACIAVSLTLLAFSLELNGLTIGQYIYRSIKDEYFPHSPSFHFSDCTVNKSSDVYQHRTAVQKEASMFSMYTSLAETFPAIIMSGVICSLSDKFGRKKSLAVNLTMMLTALLMIAFGIHFEINIYFFILFSAISNLGGGVYSSLSLSLAYVSDITKSGEKRTLLIALIEACFGIGMTVSGLISGHIIEKMGFFGSILMSCTLLCFAILIVIFIVPESARIEANIQSTSLLAHITAIFSFYRKNSVTGRRSRYIFCLVIFIMACFSKMGKGSIELLYILNAPFCWSAVTIGYFSSISLGFGMVIGMIMVKLLQRTFSEEWIGILSAISNVASCITEAFATGVTIFLVPVIGVLSTLILPIIRAIMSKMTTKNKQGALFAGIAIVEIGISGLAHVATKDIYMHTVEFFSGFIFLVYATFSVVTICLLTIFRLKTRYNEPGEESINRSI